MGQAKEAGNRLSAGSRDDLIASKAPRFGLMLGLLALLALVVRENYVLATIVDVPIRGDIREYVACAWNLVQHGVFSSTLPPHPPVADSFRFPGYPWLIALGMKLFPQDPSWASIGAWYPFVIQMQVLLGTATCVLVAMLARCWVNTSGSIAAGLLLALWPHHIAATDVMLSEVLFGFMLVAGLTAFARVQKDHRNGWYATAGAAFGCAYLVNPLILLFPPLLVPWIWRLGRRRGAVIMLAVFLLPVLAMTARNAGLGIEASRGSAQRAAINFVQGSWPSYHSAYRKMWDGDPSTRSAAKATIDAISSEITLFENSPWPGLQHMGHRMANDPWSYLNWYSTKPWLLWGWRMEIGNTDISFLPVKHSPLDHNPVLHRIVALYRAVNPILTTIMLACAVTVLIAGFRRKAEMPVLATSGLALYLTLVHEVLQAEPRYAIAYRGIEALLVVTALAWVVRRLTPRPAQSGDQS